MKRCLKPVGKEACGKKISAAARTEVSDDEFMKSHSRYTEAPRSSSFSRLVEFVAPFAVSEFIVLLGKLNEPKRAIGFIGLLRSWR